MRCFKWFGYLEEDVSVGRQTEARRAAMQARISWEVLTIFIPWASDMI